MIGRTNQSAGASSASDGSTDEIDLQDYSVDDRFERLVDWNVELFSSLIKKMLARYPETNFASAKPIELAHGAGLSDMPLSEVREIISLPEYSSQHYRDPTAIDIPNVVLDQLRTYGKKTRDFYCRSSKRLTRYRL